MASCAAFAHAIHECRLGLERGRALISNPPLIGTKAADTHRVIDSHRSLSCARSRQGAGQSASRVGTAVKLEVDRRPIRGAGTGAFSLDALLSENSDPCGFKQAHDLKRDVPED